MRSRRLLLFASYLILLFAAAVVRDVWLIPLASRLPAGWLIEPIWKIIFWLLPSWLFVQHVEHKPPLTFWGMQNVGRGVLVGLCGCGAIALSVGLPLLVKHAVLHGTNIDGWVNGVVLVGLFEEIPFRGIVFGVPFSHSGTYVGKGVAFVLSCTFFALIHVPLWIVEGSTVPQLISQFILIWIVGAFFTAAYWYSGSLWSSVLMHTFYDALATFFS